VRRIQDNLGVVPLIEMSSLSETIRLQFRDKRPLARTERMDQMNPMVCSA
jgi:hypothetical protein